MFFLSFFSSGFFGVAASDSVDRMLERFDALTNYTALLDSEGEGGRNRIYYTYQKPGFIRMDFIQPHKGARLIYNPESKRVHLQPFSGSLIQLRLSPENRLIRDPKGHTVDRSDIGSLLRTVKKYADEGIVTLLAPESVDGLLCEGVLVEAVDNTWFLWVHPELGLPVKVERFSGNGEGEIVFLRRLEVDVELGQDVFLP
ncbi:hypothetical protein [Desulfobotulus mexicanus]|uniref:Outer membrane lipoprotein carrier protein LolA n=1 Tax=Desulfobotulus mexicanus TaxID=2586642 RepID=A0A5S5MCL3_9BACT|nr:hypothetical protein [Desulfobotulus mexicanus]TYT73468.1 hypothetical protein FIM25_15095 [Desulfobotulus mexicanus]